jgi:uncharacterized protein YceH (UPF0502 family)
MSLNLSPEEVRVLGVLIEKELTTPDYYPMTLNALTNACNQKSNRDPVVQFVDTDVLRAFDQAKRRDLMRLVEDSSGSRTNKYRHRLVELFRLTPAQTAIMCELMLRGAQTSGELRARAERMHRFSSLDEVEIALTELSSVEHFVTQTFGTPLVICLPRQVGKKEPRYAHLLSGEPDFTQINNDAAPMPKSTSAHEERILALEMEIASLKQELRGFQEEFATFKRQFE